MTKQDLQDLRGRTIAALSSAGSAYKGAGYTRRVPCHDAALRAGTARCAEGESLNQWYVERVFVCKVKDS
jgi:hypothetical protein